MREVQTIVYDREEKLEASPQALLVFKRNLDLDELEHVIGVVKPVATVAGWETHDPAKISAAAERIRAMMKCGVGVVYPTPDDPNFFAWAVTSHYSPIVFLPARKSTSRRLYDLNTYGYLSRAVDIHLVGDQVVDEEKYEAVNFTHGEEW